MNENMKRYLLMTLLFVAFMLQAQDNKNRPKVDEMHARKWQYMVEQAKLSSQVAAKVQPVFMEYEKAVWSLMEQNKDFFKKFKEDKKSQTKPDYEGMNDRFVNIDIQKAQLFKNYYLKLKKILPAEKIFDFFNAERSFRKELIKDWQGRRGPGNR